MEGPGGESRTSDVSLLRKLPCDNLGVTWPCARAAMGETALLADGEVAPCRGVRAACSAPPTDTRRLRKLPDRIGEVCRKSCPIDCENCVGPASPRVACELLPAKRGSLVSLRKIAVLLVRASSVASSHLRTTSSCLASSVQRVTSFCSMLPTVRFLSSRSRFEMSFACICVAAMNKFPCSSSIRFVN